MMSHEVDMVACKVLPKKQHGQLFNVIVNVLLGAFSLSSLLIKRKYFDKAKRSDQVFILDVARLAIAGTIGHILNVFVAHWLDDSGVGDECKFYLVNYMLDAFVGVPLSYVIILANSSVADKRGWTSLSRRGFYGHPIDYSIWAKQTMEFTFSIALAKVILLAPLFGFKDYFERIGDILVRPVEQYPRFELLLVMVIVPTVINAIQFMLFDQILLDEYPPYERPESREEDEQDLDFVESSALISSLGGRRDQ